jgi:exodeoxyribonuclease-3
MFHAREKNAGWRIDYFICSERFTEKLEDSLIYPQYYGSDHCPVAIITKD